ncbi:MAG: hypothetical protein WDZ69_02365 [Candidatus Pacearchaeota archaeon]
MAKDNRIQMPGGFGGLMRFDEEFKSKFMLKPTHIVVFVILVVVFRVLLEFIF